jgi:hypothetical protein
MVIGLAVKDAEVRVTAFPRHWVSVANSANGRFSTSVEMVGREH